MALYLGPTAFGILGQLMTVVAITSMFAGGGIVNGLIKNLAEYKDYPDIRQRKLGAAFKIYIVTSSIISILLLIFCTSLAELVFADSKLYWIFLILAISQWLVGFYNITQSILSCVHDIESLLILNIGGTILGAGFFTCLIYYFDYKGAASGIVAMPAFMGIVACVLWKNRISNAWRVPVWATTRQDIENFLSYAGVMLVAVIAVPSAQIYVRLMVGDKYGWDHIGYWQGILKLSDVYMQLVGMLLANYALPRFAALKTKSELSQQGIRFGLSLVLIMTVGFCVIYSLRNMLINMLYAEDFKSMEALFMPQLCGDILRIIGSIFVYVAISRGSRLIPIASELIQAVGLVVLSWLILPWYQAASPVYAYLFSSAILIVVMYVAYSILAPKWFASNDKLESQI